MAIASTAAASAQIEAHYIYNGLGRSFPIHVRLPGGPREASIELLAPVTADVVEKAAVRGGDEDLAKLFPDIWTAKRPTVLYAQLIVDGRKSGPALVRQPMLNPQSSRL